jgi:hypothetical protein
MTNWATLRTKALTAAEGVLGGAWDAASLGTTNQINLLIQTAKYIAENRASFTADESEFLMNQQKLALQTVLTAYESIGIALAINTINAVMQVIIQAVPALVRL